MDRLVNCGMPALQGKKEEVVGSKVSQRERAMLQEICERADRSMSYVLRELAMRGVTLYLQDGKIKADETEQAQIERHLQNGKPGAPLIKAKAHGEETPKRNTRKK